MPYLRSSAIRRAEYNDVTRTLTLWFVDSGGPYYYYNVPRNIFDGLLSARSPGTYYNLYIRDQYGA